MQLLAAVNGSIGYVGISYLEQTKNAAALSLIDLPGAKSYPIVNVEYAIARTHGYDPQTAAALRAFLDWTVDPAGGNAGALLAPVHFVALPDRLRAHSRAQIAKIQ